MAKNLSWKKSQKRQELLGKTATYILLVLGSILLLLPFVWMVSTALKPMSEVYTFPPKWIPNPPRWENIPRAFAAAPWGIYLKNTVQVTLLAVIGATMSSLMVGFSFARLNWPGRRIFFMMILATMMLPGHVTMIPHYIMYSKLGWSNSILPLVVPSFFGGGAFFIFLARQFFMTIPLELDEAAKIDGCSNWGIFWRIILPMSKPVAATVAIFQFMGSWNDFLGPLLYLRSPDKWTISLGMRLFQSLHGESQLSLMMVIATLAILPCLFLFFTAQRYFIQGVVVSGVKG